MNEWMNERTNKSKNGIFLLTVFLYTGMLNFAPAKFIISSYLKHPHRSLKDNKTKNIILADKMHNYVHFDLVIQKQNRIAKTIC